MSHNDAVQPPVAAKRDHKVYFGAVDGEDRGPNPMNPPRVHNDPYFWLRDDSRSSPEVIEHLKQENAYFQARTADLAELKDEIYKEHISHIEETDMSAPYPHGPYLYYTREVEGKSYKIHCRVPQGQTPGPEGGAEEILMDINAVAEGKPFCDVADIVPAPPTHQCLAYSVDWNGQEVYTIELMAGPTADASAIPKDKIEGTNGEVIWAPDGSAFFYTTKDDALRDDKVWRHVVGQPQSSDVCLYTENDALFGAGMGKSSDGQTLFLFSGSSETTEVHMLDLRRGNDHTELELVRKREKGTRYSVEMHGTDTLVIVTNEGGALNNKVVLADRSAPAVNKEVLIPCTEACLIDNIAIYATFMVVEGRRDGLTRVWTMNVNPATHAFDTSCEMKEVEMPEPIFEVHPVASQTVEYDTKTFRINYSSLSTPSTWFDVNPVDHTREAVKVRQVGGGYDAANFRVERRYATAPDGVKIPLSMVYHKDLDMSQPHPCFLYGYGSYGLCMEPAFTIKTIPYTERGMIYVIAHIRGGSELGRAWYEVGGKYRTKRNTFSDFIAAAEYLVDNRVTTPSQLATEGRSAGGLLMGAVLNMRPDLFQAAIAGVPFVDVMTTMCDPSIPLTTGEWEEWGNPNEYKFYDYMLSYSPMDNVRAQAYPNIYIQAGLFDPRVAYWEPTKWVQKVREHKTNSTEVLLNMDLESGHFSAKDRYKYWREAASQQAFVCKHLKAMTRVFLKK